MHVFGYQASPKESLQLQQGLISALLADKKPSEVFPYGHSCSQIYVLTIWPPMSSEVCCSESVKDTCNNLCLNYRKVGAVLYLVTLPS